MTEVVYRLYETVDELSSVIENARSVPMSGGSCMVPRDVLLDLLDDLRHVSSSPALVAAATGGAVSSGDLARSVTSPAPGAR